MMTPPTRVFVGRQQEITELETALSLVRSRGGRCVLLSGEAGIGKSHLSAEVQARASAQGCQTLAGRCFEQDRSFPYAPLIDMLRPLFAQGPVDARLAALGPLAPELAPELAPSAARPDSRLEKRQLFEALTGLLWQQAREAPLLLVVEDLHWSDEASLEFLLFLVRRIAEQPILLLLTSRPARAQAGLVELLAGLDREPLAQELRLKPLSRAEVARLLQAILAQAREPSAEFVDAIYRLSEGNPFFAEEMCTALIAGGDVYYAGDQWRRKPLAQIDIPDSIQRVVARQVEGIGEPARRLIDLAAVSGRTFDFAVLQALTGQTDDELLALVKELVAARLVVEEGADQFSFRHALTREALYTRLLVRERQALHGQLVAAIEQVHAGAAEGQLEALSYHAYEGALWSKTGAYARQAGEKALALFAPHAAVEQFTRAITAADRLSQAPPPALYRLRGQAHDTLGSFAAARADYETALQAAADAGDQRARWQLLLDLALLWASRDYARTGDYCRQALDLARAMADDAATGHSLNRLGNWLMNSGQPFEALDYHREALALFEALDDRAGTAGTLDLLAMTSNQSGDPAATVDYYERAIPILRELQDWQTLSSSLANLTLYTLSVAQAEEAVALARETGWQSGEAYALTCLAFALFGWGRVGESLAAQAESLALAQAIEHPQWQASAHAFFGTFYAELLAHDRAQAHFSAALALAEEIGSTFFSWMARGGLASIYLLQDKAAAAEALLAGLPDAWIPALYSVRLAQIELALREEDASRALRLVEEMLTLRSASRRAIGIVPYFTGPGLRLQARALRQLGPAAEAVDVLQQALALYTASGVVRGRWRIYLDLGAAYLDASQTDQAREMFAAAREQIESLAAAIDDEDLRAAFLRRAAAMIPELKPPTPRQAAKQEYGGLTRRERQVATVVAQGLTNQEIADELVVSIKTVEAHVTRILSKLGFTSRAQVAAWAVDRGLAAAPRDLDSLAR